jgi:hypothetical protein
LVAGLSWPAGAQGPADGPTLFFDDAPAGLANRPDFAVTRSRTVDPNLDQLNDESIVLNLFEGVSFLATRDKTDAGLGGSLIWVGHLHGVPQSQVILVDQDGDLSGTIKWPGNIYAVRPLGNGQHAIDQIDPNLLPPLAQPLLRRAPGPPPGAEQTDGGGTSEESLASAPATLVDETIDVMVVYTAAARDSNGGTAGIEGMIQAAIVEANTAYENSGVGITLNPVEISEVGYIESGVMSQSLQDLTTDGDGAMDEVHAWRDLNDADMVSLITEDDDYCGVAWLMQELDFSFESGAFSVVYSTCLTRHTLAHELGHGMGSMHDRANSSVPGVFPYSYGHNSPTDNWYTVMSYSCGSSCDRIGQFSNPDVSIGEVPTGIDHDEDPNDSADNARSLNNTAFTVARFRQEEPTDPPTGVVSALVATAVSYNQVDLAWSYSGDDQWTFEIERSDDGGGTWDPVDSIPGNFTNYADMTAYPETTYVYQVQAANPAGGSGWISSNSTTTLAAPPHTDDTAIGETSFFGNVGGNYTNTAGDDGISQTITEKATGGKPANRTSKADHEWIIDVTGGSSVTLFIKAAATATSDFDVFDFYYSTDAFNYYYAITVGENTSPDTYQAIMLPSTTIGTLFVRVVDRDRLPGNTSLDSVTVDHMYIRSEVAFGNRPDRPTNLSADAVSAGQINLAWDDNSDDEYGFYVYRSKNGNPMAAIATTAADATTYSDDGLISSTTYDYEIRAFNAVGESAPSDPASATTDAGIFLWVEPYKIKGNKKVHLRWSGATSNHMNVYRDGDMIALGTNNDRLFTDHELGKKGPDSYLYWVCEYNVLTLTEGDCSNIAEALF